MKKKISKIAFFVIVSAFAFLTLGIFLANGFSNGYALAVSGNGGLVYVSSSSTNTINNQSTITGGSATNGGGVYVASGGTLKMTGGVVSGNKATSGSGHDVYNNGTFTMTNGTIGTSGSSQTGYGIYNTGTMNLYGGTVYDNIYSSVTFNTEVSANITGTITLGNNATIVVQDYDGTTPSYKIVLSSSRANGVVMTLKGSSTSPSLSKLTISGYDTQKSKVSISPSSGSSTSWEVKLVPQQYTLTLNKGTGVSSVSGAGTYDYGTIVQISSSPSQGYSGGYWTGSKTINSQTSTVTMTENMTLTAHANPNIYKITLDNQSETTEGTTEIYEKYATGYYSDSAGSTSITSITIPTRNGYTFDGYYTSTGGSGTQIISNSGSIVAGNTKFTENTTIYAKWTLATYTITFNKSGGTGGTDSISIKYGESLPSITVPSRAGYTFKGYYYITLKSSTQYYTSSGTSSKTYDLSSDVTLTADWTGTIKTYERDGDYVYFGSYPQSIGIIPSNAIVSTNGDIVSYNGNSYRKIGSSYYKYEPIKWKIVKESGSYLTLIAENILNASAFKTTSERDYYDNAYYYYESSDRVHKSDLFQAVVDFHDIAFSSEAKEIICADEKTYYLYVYINSSGNFVGQTATTTSRYWVPSYEELYNLEKNSGYNVFKTATDYASACGADGSYWTSSGYYSYNEDSAWYVKKSNTDNGLGDDAGSLSTKRGLVPMITIEISTILSCGHPYDESKTKTEIVPNSDPSTGHHTETTYYCSKCSNTKTVTSNNVSHSNSSTYLQSSLTEFEYKDNSYHTITYHYKCSTCNGTWTSSTSGGHSGTVVSGSYSSNGSLSHDYKLTCSSCGATVSKSETHTWGLSQVSGVYSSDENTHWHAETKNAVNVVNQYHQRLMRVLTQVLQQQQLMKMLMMTHTK